MSSAIPSATRASTASSESAAAASQRSASSSLGEGLGGAHRGGPGERQAGRRLVRLGRLRAAPAAAAGGGAPSVSTTSTLSLAAAGVARQVAAVGHRAGCRRSRTARIRRAGSEDHQPSSLPEAGQSPLSVPPDLATLAPPRPLPALPLSGSAAAEGSVGTSGLSIFAEAVDQALPLVGLEHRA